MPQAKLVENQLRLRQLKALKLLAVPQQAQHLAHKLIMMPPPPQL
jgi:hypothetical protein